MSYLFALAIPYLITPFLLIMIAKTELREDGFGITTNFKKVFVGLSFLVLAGAFTIAIKFAEINTDTDLTTLFNWFSIIAYFLMMGMVGFIGLGFVFQLRNRLSNKKSIEEELAL